jgi:putative intracellular protease/amidase
MQDVLCFVFDSLSDWEPGYAVAGINNPMFQRAPGSFRVRTVAPRRDVVTTTGGIRIQPDLALSDPDVARCAMLIIPGGRLWDEGGNGEAIDAAKAVLANGGLVAAICGATAGLAKGGLLDARKHTSNAREYLGATGYKGAHLYQDVPAVTDGTLITAGAVAPVDFARHIFAALGLYTQQVLDAWFGLFKTGKPEYFAALTRAAQG